MSLTSNPYAKKFGASAREQKRASEAADLYAFDPSAAAHNLIAATIGASQAAAGMGGGGGGGGGGMGDYSQLASQRQGTAAFGPGGAAAGGAEGPRPMTSARGAGYTSTAAGGRKGTAGGGGAGSGAAFDPLGQASTHGPAPPLIPRSQDSPEQAARDLEKGVNTLLEQSAAAAHVGKNYALALEKAKEATKAERALCKHRDKHNLSDQINYDLTYAVCFNLANSYALCKMYREALDTYALVVKNKQYPSAGRLRVNMGNIYFAQKKYPSAIKMYRMAMDQLASTNRDMRHKIMRNIGVAFVKLGQFAEAVQSFEAVMDQAPDAHTAFNLTVCYYALGERDKMRRAFVQLLNVPEYAEQAREDEEEAEADSGAATGGAGGGAGGAAVPPGTAPTVDAKTSAVLDELKAERRARRKLTHRYIHQAARLIAPVIERDGLAAGFDWVIEHLQAPRGGAAGAAGTSVKAAFPSLAMELQIAKGISFLKSRGIREAIEVFKSFERNDASVGCIDQAATNLSFLYFLEGDLRSSERYADLAVRADRYNAKALVNKANYLFVRGELEAAKELYLEAIGVEADCVEAIYNLGLCNKRLGLIKDALQAFRKLHRIVPRDTQVVWQMANAHELLGELSEAATLFTTLHSLVPSDPKVLSRLGTLYTKEDEETQAFHNFHDSFQAYPVNMDVISWLGVWFVKAGLYEDAVGYFQRAAEIEPQEVKWQLMVASCYRRMNDYKHALALYKKIHKQDPENIECLRYLCTITKDTNDREYEEYSKLLKKAERAAAQRDAQMAGGQAYLREDVAQQHQAYADHHDAPGTRAPDVSPGATQRGLPPQAHAQMQAQQQQQYGADPRSVTNLADGFRPELSPAKQGPTFSGGGGGGDEWGEGLGDELLP